MDFKNLNDVNLFLENNNINISDYLKYRLIGYRYIENINNINLGGYIRGIKKNNNKFFYGGKINNIQCSVIETLPINGKYSKHIYDFNYYLFYSENLPINKLSNTRFLFEKIINDVNFNNSCDHKYIKKIY